MFKIMFMKSLQQVGKLLALQGSTEQAGKKAINIWFYMYMYIIIYVCDFLIYVFSYVICIYLNVYAYFIYNHIHVYGVLSSLFGENAHRVSL